MNPTSHYEDMTLSDLKQELRKRNAKLSGRKRDLVERLQFYDRNSLVESAVNDLQPDLYSMNTPDPLSYKDINTQSPITAVSEHMVEAYLEMFQQKITDKHITMYHERFLRSVRFCLSGNITFIKARVSAEMKKNCIYIVDLQLDLKGVIEAAQCECAVGMGPHAHCKHVILVLFGLTKQKDSTGILIKDACTQVLQSFHRAKPYGGSPVKMRDLSLRNSEILKNLSHFDPRPMKRRNEQNYQDHFRNTWLNVKKSDITIRQLYEPANLHAFVNDHDYLASNNSFEEQFLASMHITTITEQERNLVEKETRGQASSKKWHQERMKRMHASNFGRICTAGNNTNFRNLALSLMQISHISTKSIRHGRQYELVAIQDYEKQGVLVRRCGIFICQTTAFLACSPDGLVDPDGLVEVKCPYSAREMQITPKNIPYLQTDEKGMLLLKKNHIYYYQIQGELLCTARLWCDLVVWTFNDMKIIRIARDDQFITDMLRQLTEFYNRFFRPALLQKYFYRQ